MAAEEDDFLAMLFLFHKGRQITLLLDDDDASGVISVVGRVLLLLVGELDGGGLPDIPSARS